MKPPRQPPAWFIACTPASLVWDESKAKDEPLQWALARLCQLRSDDFGELLRASPKWFAPNGIYRRLAAEVVVRISTFDAIYRIPDVGDWPPSPAVPTA